MAAANTETDSEHSGAVTVGAAPTDFRFRCLGHDFRAWVERGPAARSLCIACELGDLPYSAENGHGRRNALMLLSQMGNFAGTRISLSEYRSVAMTTVVPIADDEDAVGLISIAAHSVLRNFPIIALFGEMMGQPAAPDS